MYNFSKNTYDTDKLLPYIKANISALKLYRGLTTLRSKRRMILQIARRRQIYRNPRMQATLVNLRPESVLQQ